MNSTALALALSPLLWGNVVYAPFRILINSKCTELVDSIVYRISGYTFQQEQYMNYAEIQAFRSNLNSISEIQSSPKEDVNRGNNIDNNNNNTSTNSNNKVILFSTSHDQIRKLENMDFFGEIRRIRALFFDLKRYSEKCKQKTELNDYLMRSESTINRSINNTDAEIMEELQSIRICIEQLEQVLKQIYECIQSVEREIIFHSQKWFHTYRKLDLTSYFDQLSDLGNILKIRKTEFFNYAEFWKQQKS